MGCPTKDNRSKSDEFAKIFQAEFSHADFFPGGTPFLFFQNWVKTGK